MAIQVKEVVNDAKKAAKRTNDKTGTIVRDAVLKVNNQVAIAMPSISTFSRTISRAKKREETIINNATDIEILEIPEIYIRTLKGCDFLLHDSNNGKQRFFMYATKKNLEQLKKCKLWCKLRIFRFDFESITYLQIICFVYDFDILIMLNKTGCMNKIYFFWYSWF